MAEQVLGGRFALVDRLGSGGMSEVWRARDEVLGRTVAVKVLAGRYAGDPGSRSRIRDEARAAAALSHPNVAQVYDYGESDIDGVPTPYVVMELVRGGTLQDRLAGGPVPSRFAMQVCAEVAAALAAAHADGLVHRDIKPANVMVTPDGVKVVDFGIAAAIGATAGRDGTAGVIGTPAYVAPERLIDDAVEPASDVYALGVLLYRLLCGRAPWSADTTTQMLSAHIYVEPEPLPPLPDVPDYVVALCNRCLHKDPTQRPSAREVASVLARGAGIRVNGEELPQAGADRPEDEPSVLIRPAAGTPLTLLPGTSTSPATPTPATPTPATSNPATSNPATSDAATSESGTSTPATSTSGPSTPPTGSRSRRRRLPIVVAVLLATAGAAAVLLLPDGPRDAGSVAATVAEPRTGLGGAAASQPATPGASQRPTPATEGRTTNRDAVPATTRRATAGPSTVPVAATIAPGIPTLSPPTQAVPSPTPTTRPRRARTLVSAGGTVRAVCRRAAVAYLLSWTATPPYHVASVRPGPAAVTSVVFKHHKVRIQMTITCHDGVPVTSNVRF